MQIKWAYPVDYNNAAVTLGVMMDCDNGL